MDTGTRLSGNCVKRFSISRLPFGQLVHPFPVISSSRITRFPDGTKGMITRSFSVQEYRMEMALRRRIYIAFIERNCFNIFYFILTVCIELLYFVVGFHVVVGENSNNNNSSCCCWSSLLQPRDTVVVGVLSNNPREALVCCLYLFHQKFELTLNLNPLKAGSSRQIPPEQTIPSTCLT